MTHKRYSLILLPEHLDHNSVRHVTRIAFYNFTGSIKKTLYKRQNHISFHYCSAGYQQFNGGAVHSTGWAGKPSGVQSMLTSQHPPIYSIVAMQAEVRTLEFWRSIIGECAATFFYVLIVCSVATITMVTQEGRNVIDPGTTTYCALR